MALGEGRAAVEKVWGTPDDIYENPFDKSNVIVAYQKKGVEVSYRDGKVDCVNLYPTKQNWVCFEGGTSEGVWVNSKESEVRQALGQPVNEAPQALNYPGLTVFLKDGKVDYLTVTAKASELVAEDLPAKVDSAELGNQNVDDVANETASGAKAAAGGTALGTDAQAVGEAETAQNDPASDAIRNLKEHAAKALDK